MRWPWTKDIPKEVKRSQFEDVLTRLIASQDGSLGSMINPDNCMQSPTVHAIVTAISRRLSITPVHVFSRTSTLSGEVKEKLPNHPVTRLLQKPNQWQSRIDFWQDATSVFIRHGRFYAYKSRGSTGPIRELIPLHPGSVTPKQDATNYNVTFDVTEAAGRKRTLSVDKVFHARGPARDFLTGDSPVTDVAQTIAMEILAEKFGVTFFQNGALPLLVFSFMEGSAGFREESQEKDFIKSFQDTFSGKGANRGMLLPKGMDKPSPITVEHDKAQFIETRKYQRTVIAGAFGVPPTIAGDLERATFNNVEQMDKDFTLNVVLPVAQAFEASMERDLLTDADRAKGIVIRFNLDSVMRADFKSRQDGLRVQRDAGIISSNEWREIEGKNPITDEQGGNDYMRPANMMVAGEDEVDENDTDDTFTDQESGEPGV